MADLNLRGVSADLIRKLKSDAALAGMTLRDHCIVKLRGTHESDGNAKAGSDSGRGAEEPAVSAVREAAEAKRSDYVRCTPCGMNWLDGEDLTKDPRLSREPYLSNVRNRAIQSFRNGTAGWYLPDLR